MSFKGILIIIAIVALAVFITFGVEELRFRFINRVLLTEVKDLRGKNQTLLVKNNGLSEKIKTLKAQLEIKAQEYEEKIGQLEQEVKELEIPGQTTSPLRVEIKILQEKIRHLQTKNDNLIKQMKTLEVQSEEKIQRHEEEKKTLEKKISHLQGAINKARTILAPE